MGQNEEVLQTFCRYDSQRCWKDPFLFFANSIGPLSPNSGTGNWPLSIGQALMLTQCDKSKSVEMIFGTTLPSQVPRPSCVSWGTWLHLTWTTLMTKQRDMGRVARMISNEMKVMKWAHRPGPSSQLPGETLSWSSRSWSLWLAGIFPPWQNPTMVGKCQ